MDAVRRGADVSFQGIQRSFLGTGKVIDNVTFSASSGEFVAILGPSGCGKSTFLRLAAGLDRADSGQINVVSSGADHFRSFVFQEAHLLPWRSVLENVALPLRLIGRSKAEARDEAVSALAKVGLSDALAKYPGQLSGGMKMRTAVARALVTKPHLLLMDEPFAALDENTRHQLQEELRRLWETQPMTVLFVTHSVSEAVFLANRAIVLSQRPARIVLDHGIKLPRRDRDVRTSVEFNEHVRLLLSAFDSGMSRSQ